MSQCEQKPKNLKICNCTYTCSKKGNCCECIVFHRNMGEFPACFFSREAERTYDRSFVALKKDREG